MSPEFLYLRGDYDTAISLPGILLIVLLMIIFCLIKCLKRHEFSHNRRFPQLLFLNFTDHLFGNNFLFLTTIENHRAILRADICPLTVQGSRVMDGTEDLQNFFQRNDLWVKRNLYHFGMTCRPGAD